MILQKLVERISVRMFVGVALCVALFAFVGCPDGGNPGGGPGGGGGDTTLPIITLVGNELIVVLINGAFTDPGATVRDDDPEYPTTTAMATIRNDSGAEVSTDTFTDTAGVYTITYTAPADTAGNEPLAVTRTVRVQVSGSPVITLTGAAVIVVDIGDATTDINPGATVIDSDDPTYSGMVTATIRNSDGTTLTAINPATAGIYTITYTAPADADGNPTVAAIRTVQIGGTMPVGGSIPATITLMGDSLSVFVIGHTTTDVDPGATAIDSDDPAYSGMVETTIHDIFGSPVTTIDTATAGTYTITYTAPADADRNPTAAVIRTVRIEVAVPPMITLTGDDTIVVEIGDTTTDTNPGFDVSTNNPPYTRAVSTVVTDGDGGIIPEINTNFAGIYTITYTAPPDIIRNIPSTVTRTVRVSSDFDGDTLIDISFIEYLNAIRHNLDGTSYRATAGGAEVQCGTDGTTACTGYELLRNLDFASPASYVSGVVNTDWRPTGGNPDSATNDGWEPIGACNTDADGALGPCGDNDDDAFTATFAGNDFTITNLYVRRSGDVGLFGLSSGTIQDIGIVDARVYGTAVNANAVGGLIGANGGTIITSHALGGSVNGGALANNVGGLVGFNIRNAIITASYATGDVNGGAGSDDNVGGLVGRNDSGTTITVSYATGDVNAGAGSDDFVGGLVGRNDGGGSGGGGTITASYATGDVNGGAGSDRVGGFIGDATNRGGRIVIASYATGDVNGGAGTDNVGSLIGFGIENPTASYGFGMVTNGTQNIAITRSTDASDATAVPNACAITEANSSTMTSMPDNRWDPTQWDFGTAAQRPIVLYNDEPVPGQTNRDCN